MSYLEELVKVMDSAGDKEVIVVCDFDGTLTEAGSDSSMNGMAKAMGYDSDFAKARDALYHEYAPLIEAADEETAYKLYDKWWKAQMNLFTGFNLPPESYTDALGRLNLTIRSEAATLLKFCEKQDIPVFVVSAGLGNLIIPTLAFSGLLSMNMRVLANFVRYNEEKAVSYTPVVTPVNKAAHLYLELEEFENYHAVVFGNEARDLRILPEEICTAVKVD